MIGEFVSRPLLRLICGSRETKRAATCHTAASLRETSRTKKLNQRIAGLVSERGTWLSRLRDGAWDLSRRETHQFDGIADRRHLFAVTTTFVPAMAERTRAMDDQVSRERDLVRGSK